MTDGFSTPDPAPLSDQDQDEIPDNAPEFEITSSCENCAHKPVCAVYSGVKPLLDGWDEKTGSEPPLNAEHLALICRMYAPIEQ